MFRDLLDRGTGAPKDPTRGAGERRGEGPFCLEISDVSICAKSAGVPGLPDGVKIFSRVVELRDKAESFRWVEGSPRDPIYFS